MSLRDDEKLIVFPVYVYVVYAVEEKSRIDVVVMITSGRFNVSEVSCASELLK